MQSVKNKYATSGKIIKKVLPNIKIYVKLKTTVMAKKIKNVYTYL